MITNKKNNRSYIGQSIDIEKRIKAHFWAAYKENIVEVLKLPISKEQVKRIVKREYFTSF